MLARSVRYTHRLVILFVCLTALLISVGCAAPLQPPMSLPIAVESDEPQGYFLPHDSASEIIQATVDEIYPGGEWQAQSFGKMTAITENYRNGLPLTTNDALQWPVDFEINGEALTEGLMPHLLGRSGVTCVESGGQAFWIMDTSTVASLLDELDAESELYENFLSCGDEANCEDCGCIGPMGGPTCPTTLQPIQAVLHPSGD